MGLDVSHDCWSGAYSAFYRWRYALGTAAGYKYFRPKGSAYETLDIDWHHVSFENLQGEWDTPPDDPLLILLVHSDYDGKIPAKYCEHIAARLEQLLDKIDTVPAGGHLARLGLRGTTERFIEGLRLAASNNEDIEFA